MIFDQMRDMLRTRRVHEIADELGLPAVKLRRIAHEEGWETRHLTMDRIVRDNLHLSSIQVVSLLASMGIKTTRSAIWHRWRRIRGGKAR